MDSFEFDLHDIQLGEQLIVEKCLFSVKKSRTSALIGPSGCGKTTMLNVIAGLKSFPHLRGPDDINLAYIFQDARLIPWLNIEQNLNLIEPQLSSDNIEQILKDVKLEDVTQAYPIQLSGGMQRRVSIARAFVNEPQLVLLDEAFSSIDVPTARHLLKLVRGLLNKNLASALLVTHNLQEALALADDLYFLSNKPTRVILHMENPLYDQNVNTAHPELEDIKSQELAILSQYPNILSGYL